MGTDWWPTGTCSFPNLGKNWRSGYELHPNHFKPTPQMQAGFHLHLPKAGNWTIFSRLIILLWSWKHRAATSHPTCLQREDREERTIQPPPSQHHWRVKMSFPTQQGGKGHSHVWRKINYCKRCWAGAKRHRVFPALLQNAATAI